MLSFDPFSSPDTAEETKSSTNPSGRSASDKFLEKLVATTSSSSIDTQQQLATKVPAPDTTSSLPPASATSASATVASEQTISESKQNALQMEKALQYVVPLYEYSSHIEPKVVELVSTLRRLTNITDNHLHFSPFESSKITTALWKTCIQQFQQLKSFLVQEYNLRNQLIEKEYMHYLDPSTLLILHQSQQKYFDIFNQIHQFAIN